MTLAPSPKVTELSVAPLTTGICSVTLRSRGVEDVVATAARAGLSGIEWGTDVHVRDAGSADRAREASRAAGLKVLSLGSYYSAGSFGDFDGIIALALRAGAPRIRVWAGNTASQEADRRVWDAVVDDSQRIAALAAAHSLDVAFEYHRGTLTDSAETTLALLERVDRPNLGTYWQPQVGLSDQQALASLQQVMDHLVGVHCFSWWPQLERLPLEGRMQFWESVADLLRANHKDVDLMLEFVQDDLPENVVRDAAFLGRLAGAVA